LIRKAIDLSRDSQQRDLRLQKSVPNGLDFTTEDTGQGLQEKHE
jgi:hypothetical protein